MPATTQSPTPPKQKLLPFNKSIKLRLQGVMAARAKQLMGGKDLNVKMQGEEMEKFYHGNPNIVSQVTMMLTSIRGYENMFERKDIHNTGASNKDSFPLVLASPFNVDNSDWVIGGNITKHNLSQTRLQGAGELLTGRTLLSYANAEIREAKKIVSLVPEAVKEKILEPPVDGEYNYASGKKEEDLIHFIRVRMKNWDVYNGPSGGTDKTVQPDVDCDSYIANVLVDAVEELDWDLSNVEAIKTAAVQIYNACTSKIVKVSFAADEAKAKRDIFQYIISSEGDPSPTDVLYEIVSKNNLDSDVHDADAMAEAVKYFRHKSSSSEESKLKSYQLTEYPKGWCLFWLQGPLSPRKCRLNILALDDGSKEDVPKEKNSGRKSHRDNEKKAKDKERNTGAANGEGRGVAYSSQRDLAMVAQQQRKQDQTDFVSKMAQITTVLTSLESTRESTMKMASEWRLGNKLDKWEEYMNKAADLNTEIIDKRNELDQLERHTSATSHVDSFLAIGTDDSGANSAKKRKRKSDTLDLTGGEDVDSDSSD